MSEAPAAASTSVMNHVMIAQFVDTAAEIMEQLSNFIAQDDPDPEDAAEVRRLRVMATAMLAACDAVARMQPPPALVMSQAAPISFPPAVDRGLQEPPTGGPQPMGPPVGVSQPAPPETPPPPRPAQPARQPVPPRR